MILRGLNLLKLVLRHLQVIQMSFRRPLCDGTTAPLHNGRYLLRCFSVAKDILCDVKNLVHPRATTHYTTTLSTLISLSFKTPDALFVCIEYQIEIRAQIFFFASPPRIWGRTLKESELT